MIKVSEKSGKVLMKMREEGIYGYAARQAVRAYAYHIRKENPILAARLEKIVEQQEDIISTLLGDSH